MPSPEPRAFGDLRPLIERIRRGDCVLVLGPRASRSEDGRSFEDELAAKLHASAGPTADPPPGLRRAAELHYRQRHDRDELELAVQDFYAAGAKSTTQFHRDLASLPFRLCLNASPDSLMETALEASEKKAQRGYYHFKRTTKSSLLPPTPDRPLVFHLFGHYEDAGSLVLTEGDLIEFLVSIVRGAPPVSDQVRSILADPSVSFLFLGFGFENWYLRVLLQVLNVYGHRSKPIAYEDSHFFSHPEREQTVSFFSGDRVIDFRSFHWADFARELRASYEEIVPSPLPSPPPDAPRVFLSHASEDRAAVEALGEALQLRGVRVWQDRQDLRGGDDWNRVLLDVIARKVDYVVVVQTPAMVSAVSGVFHREIEAALRRNSEMGEFDGQKLRFLLPVTIGACPTLASLRSLHTLDAGTSEGVDRLAASILEDWSRRAMMRPRVATTS